MIDDAITTVGFALQSYINICEEDAKNSGEDIEEEKSFVSREREELILAWSIIRSHLDMSDDVSDNNLQPERGH